MDDIITRQRKEFSIGNGGIWKFLYCSSGNLHKDGKQKGSIDKNLTIVEKFPNEFYDNMGSGSFKDTIYFHNKKIFLLFGDSLGFSPIFENFNNLRSGTRNEFLDNLSNEAGELWKKGAAHYETLRGLDMRSMGLCCKEEKYMYGWPV